MNGNIFKLVFLFIISLLIILSLASSYEYSDKNVSFCDNINGDNKYNCYVDVAETNGDVGICDKITGEDWIIDKRNFCFLIYLQLIQSNWGHDQCFVVHF